MNGGYEGSHLEGDWRNQPNAAGRQQEEIVRNREREERDRNGGGDDHNWNGGGNNGNHHNGGWNGDHDGDHNGWHGGERHHGWRDNNNWSNNHWGDHGRHDDRYRRWWYTHNDFYQPRWNDWRHVRHGSYFDFGYINIVTGYWGYDNYRSWSYPYWRRPYRSYVVGYVLPYDIWWEEVPYDLYWRLPPAPYGCRYLMVDRDILLVVISTGLILDAILYY